MIYSPYMPRTLLWLALPVITFQQDDKGYKAGDEWYKTHNKKWHIFTDKCPRECTTCQEKTKDLLDKIAKLAPLESKELMEKVEIMPIYGRIYFHPALAKSLYGLALIASGSTTSEGAYKKEIQACLKTVEEEIMKDDPKLPASLIPWRLAFGLLFLTEIYKRSASDSLKAKLEEAMAFLEKHQLENGGWRHAVTKDPKQTYELLACTNLIAVGLCRLRDCGLKPKDEMIEKLLPYYEKSAMKDGGMPYSLSCDWKLSKPNVKAPTLERSESARTAGAIFALITLNATDRQVYKNALAFFDANLKELVEGHACLQVSKFAGGIACYKLGKKYWSRFCDDVLSREEYPNVNGNRIGEKSLPLFNQAVDAILLQLPLDHLLFLK